MLAQMITLHHDIVETPPCWLSLPAWEAPSIKTYLADAEELRCTGNVDLIHAQPVLLRHLFHSLVVHL